MIKDVDLLEQLIERFAGSLGDDRLGYRNHVYRVINFCHLQVNLTGADLEKVVIAGAFHDLGIWTAGTFDYLPPSKRLAEAFLLDRGQQGWIAEVTGMIDDHHKLSSSSKDPAQLSEVFRRADWIDVSLGLWRFGLDRQGVRAIRAAFPDAGFHWRLITLSAKRLLSHPCDPLPMLKR